MPVESSIVRNSVLNVPQSNVRVGNCYGGIPIIMTAPHFHNADPGLLDQVIGVSPDVEKHDTYLDIGRCSAGYPLSKLPSLHFSRFSNCYQYFCYRQAHLSKGMCLNQLSFS